ncbi:cutinase-domain-containing protein [Byssothecium circinans]|uniref:Cutinase n=1 Tax=Byssothecium circinans TaxID=147558 RepID=A0A6A5TD60_9PLEO|nr:cutinase-domain-containing protein [Byssothecium circinans]
MFPTLPTLHYAKVLLCALALQSAVLVHGLPTDTTDINLDLDVDEAFPTINATNAAFFQGASSQAAIPAPLAQFPSGLLNRFLRILSTLPQGEQALDGIGRILTPLQQALANAVGIETTKSDLARNAPCADMTLVYARGTTEPGNMGLVTGPPFVDALKKELGTKSLAVQGVEYPATFAGFNKNGAEGVPSMTNFINQALTKCPNTKVVISGYSQGALVLRSTADKLPAETMAKISSVVTFGDPRNPNAIKGSEGKTLITCHENDAVCKGGFITIDHLTYAQDAPAVAKFVVQKAQV